jgi:hypothetical protein
MRASAGRPILGGLRGWPSNSEPILERVSSGVHGLAKVILRMSPGDFLGCPILPCPVRATLLLLSPPGLNLLLGLLQGLEPVGIQALAAQGRIE